MAVDNEMKELFDRTNARLTGWAELVSGTEMIRLEEIRDFLKSLAGENLEVKVEDALGELAAAEFICWNEPAPDFAALLKPLVDLLDTYEYLYFEEKVQFGHRGRTLRGILITGVGVFKAEEDAMNLLLGQRDAVLGDDEDEEVPDGGEEPIEDIEIVM